jgi:hypothetical protein
MWDVKPTSCFPKPRPQFDLEIYEYLIKKGYKFVPRQKWDKPSKECYLFLGYGSYIVITPSCQCLSDGLESM